MMCKQVRPTATSRQLPRSLSFHGGGRRCATQQTRPHPPPASRLHEGLGCLEGSLAAPQHRTPLPPSPAALQRSPPGGAVPDHPLWRMNDTITTHREQSAGDDRGHAAHDMVPPCGWTWHQHVDGHGMHQMACIDLRSTAPPLQAPGQAITSTNWYSHALLLTLRTVVWMLRKP